MTRGIILAVLAIAIGYTVYAAITKDKVEIVKAGAQAPDFEVVDLDGEKHRLADYKGQGVLLNFWGTWCGPCEREFPAMTKQYEKIKDSYCIRKNHIVGNQLDEFIDLDSDMLDAALERTREIKKKKKKEWKSPYPAPEVVRSEFRPITNPLLMIYPLDSYGADEKNSHTDDPIIGLVLSFPESKRKEKAISYTVNQIAEYADDEDNFDNDNDNTYEDE